MRAGGAPKAAARPHVARTAQDAPATVRFAKPMKASKKDKEKPAAAASTVLASGFDFKGTKINWCESLCESVVDPSLSSYLMEMAFALDAACSLSVNLADAALNRYPGHMAKASRHIAQGLKVDRIESP